jgi:probable HAF family extracellular repeat protein
METMTMQSNLIKSIATAAMLGAILSACSDPTVPSSELSTRAAKVTSTGPTVKSATPATAPQNITLDVVISGTGFEPGSSAKWLLNGLEDPRVRTNSTTVLSSTSISANITISADAVPSLYDVAVITPMGKKGIGTEKFTVLAMEQLSADGGAAARDVNASGVVAGSITGGCDGYPLPVVWKNNAVQVLPLPADLCMGWATQINDAGVVVGHANVTGAVSHTTDAIVMWTPTDHGYDARILGLAPDGTSPWDGEHINEAGHAVVNHCCAAARAYWWSQETGYVRLADVPGTAGCYASDINDNDEIAGWCRTTPASSSELNEDAAYWSSPYAAPVLLPRIAGYNYVQPAKTLNNTGLVAGEAWNSGKGGKLLRSGVTWTKSGSSWIVDKIADFGGGETAVAEVNDDGWVVGSSKISTGRFHAFLWQPGRAMRDLGAVGPESYAYGINSSASVELLVVGQSISSNVSRAVLWRPDF